VWFSSSWSYVDEDGNSLMTFDEDINDELISLTIEIEKQVWIIILRSLLNKLKVSRRYNEVS
jgi:hypothetical protein